MCSVRPPSSCLVSVFLGQAFKQRAGGLPAIDERERRLRISVQQMHIKPMNSLRWIAGIRHLSCLSEAGQKTKQQNRQLGKLQPGLQIIRSHLSASRLSSRKRCHFLAADLDTFGGLVACRIDVIATRIGGPHTRAKNRIVIHFVQLVVARVCDSL